MLRKEQLQSLQSVKCMYSMYKDKSSCLIICIGQICFVIESSYVSHLLIILILFGSDRSSRNANVCLMFVQSSQSSSFQVREYSESNPSNNIRVTLGALKYFVLLIFGDFCHTKKVIVRRYCLRYNANSRLKIMIKKD